MYSIKGCPIPFHDLLEIFDFLIHLSPVYLYQYQFLDILLNGRPIMFIDIKYVNNSYFIGYVCIR